MQSQSYRSCISNHTSNRILCRCSVPSATNTLLGPGYGLEPLDAAVHDDAPLLPETFRLQDMWMFGITKSTSELTGIYNVQAAVNGMEGSRRSYLLSLCGQLLRQVLTPCHIQDEAMNSWNFCPVICCRDGWTCARHALCSNDGPPH